MADPIVKQLDLVELLTTRNVTYLSAKPGHAPSPHGKWSVIGIIEGKDILVSREEAVIRIPISDVRKVESYDISRVVDSLKGVRKHGQKEGDIQKHFEVSKEAQIEAPGRDRRDQ
jgi:hypothetical protein